MKRFMLILGLLILAAMPFGALGAEAAPAAAGTPAPEKLGDNAALKYWIAFELMPELTPEQDKIVAHWRETPLNDTVAAVVDRSGNALGIFHDATQFRHCDWGFGKERPYTLMPHLAKARQITRLACLRSRYRVGKRDSEGAVKDILDVFTLARHCNSDERLISLMVRFAIESAATDAAADNLQRLGPEQIRQLAAGLSALPQEESFGEAILNEKEDSIAWAADLLRRSGSMGDDVFKELFGPSAQEGKVGSAEGMNQETVNRYFAELKKVQESLTVCAKMAKLPPDEFDRQTKEIEEKMHRDEQMVGRGVFSSLGRARYEEGRAEAQMAMLKAAIAIVLDGRNRVKDFKDPFGDGPFEYRPLDNGFQLKSKLVVNDVPVALTVPGQP